MRKIISIHLFVLLILIFHNNIFSQWQKLKYDIENTFSSQSFGVFNDMLYFGTYEGLYIYSETVGNWELKKNPLNIDTVEEIGISGQNFFVNYRYRGIYLSKDTFKTWIPKNKGIEKQLDVRSIATKGDTIFLATLVSGILRSTDNGDTWQEMNNGLNSKVVVNVLINGNDVFAATANGFYISYDFGENWYQRDKGLKGMEVTSIAIDRNNIYVGVYNMGIYYSSDYGLNWMPRNKGLPFESGALIYSLVIKDSIIFAAVHTMNMLMGGFYYSTNLGENWIAQNNGINTSFRRATKLAILNDYIYLVMDETFYGRIYKFFKAKISDILTSTYVENNDLNLENFYAAPARPNPANDIVKAGIYWDAKIFDVENAEKSIYDIMGNKVGDKKELLVTNIQPYSAEIVWNCSKVSSGLYFIVLNYNGQTRTIPIVVSR
ncbi:MAG: hypothetical protein N2319_01705 [Candidatus Kapabacteria bacterium]|nr:hypothetical protein [Candidatus Kapabacteria bacterium]